MAPVIGGFFWRLYPQFEDNLHLALEVVDEFGQSSWWREWRCPMFTYLTHRTTT